MLFMGCDVCTVRKPAWMGCQQANPSISFQSKCLGVISIGCSIFASSVSDRLKSFTFPGGGCEPVRDAKSELSLMISCYNLLKAFNPPSPYSSGMLTSNRPKRQYAMSSSLIVTRFAAQAILLAMLKPPVCTESVSVRAGFCMPVHLLISYARPCLELIEPHTASKKTTSFGASSSCKIQPLVDHLALSH